MKLTLRHLSLFLLAIATLYACNERNERIASTGVFQVQLKSWSYLGESDFYVIYNNLPNTQFDRETLIIIKTSKSGRESSTDTLKVIISSEQRDSIYHYAYQYLSDFKLKRGEYAKNKERLIQVYEDGGNYSVSLEEADHMKLEATKYRTAGITSSSDAATKLVSFINKQVPENFKIY